MPLSERTERALQDCYDAVLAAERWPQALQLIAESAGASSCTFCFPDDPSVSVPISTEHGEFAELWLRNQPHIPDPHLKLCSRPGRIGRPWLIEDDISTEDSRRIDPYYQETARRGKRDWWASADFSVNGRLCCLVMYRDCDGGPFFPEEGRYFARVGGRLAGIVGVAEKFAAFSLSSTLSVLEQVSSAAIVINDTGRAVGLNQAAENLLGEDFSLVQGRLAARDRESHRRLQRLVMEAISEGRTVSGSRSSLASYPPAIIHREEAPWLLAEAMPLSAFGCDLFGCGRAILLLTDLTSPRRPDAKLLGIVFGLTPGEARLAAKLGSGFGLSDAAGSLGIGLETARTQLKMIFAKTNTDRQAELVRILARLRPRAGGRASSV
jgi:DNA-binding CsgD family transcriptional regulator/PAS domain-containing protein